MVRRSPVLTEGRVRQLRSAAARPAELELLLAVEVPAAESVV
jgi:hypothetical protein